eukprot:XP_011239629.1 PREDICTED: cAMP-responsive element-binding protein-like 2 isoform X4 [Mus musculus]
MDVVVPFPVGRLENTQGKTTIPKMPLYYGGRGGQSACRAPPPSGWAACQCVCKHAGSLSWGGRRRRWPSGEVPGAASRVRSAIPELVRVPVTVASGKRTVRRRRRQSEPYPLLPRAGLSAEMDDSKFLCGFFWIFHIQDHVIYKQTVWRFHPPSQLPSIAFSSC